MSGERGQAMRDALRAIKALTDVVDRLDAGEWRTVLRDDLPHIEANIADIRALAEVAVSS